MRMSAKSLDVEMWSRRRQTWQRAIMSKELHSAIED
jgi:hypothetical protein